MNRDAVRIVQRRSLSCPTVPTDSGRRAQLRVTEQKTSLVNHVHADGFFPFCCFTRSVICSFLLLWSILTGVGVRVNILLPRSVYLRERLPLNCHPGEGKRHVRHVRCRLLICDFNHMFGGCSSDPPWAPLGLSAHPSMSPHNHHHLLLSRPSMPSPSRGPQWSG